MRRVISLATGCLVGLASGAVVAQTPEACADRSVIVERLDAGYSERPVAMGLSANGAMVEVFASSNGSFTIIATRPSGVSCILVTGESWEGLSEQVAGLPI